MKTRISLLSLLLLSVISCDTARYIAITGFAQGGTYTVKVNMKGVRERPEAIKEKVDSILGEIDRTLSGYNPGSMLSRLNKGEKIQANAMFRDIYRLSRQYWEETGGTVDIACGPLFDLWGFGFTRDSLPSDEKVQEVLGSCGFGRLVREIPEGEFCAEDLLKEKGPEPKLNFNAIAQGYSCDLVARYLYSIGIKDMLVDIGEIYCDGLNPSGQKWTLAVDKPEDGNQTPGKETSGVLHATGKPCGIVTSGNYRKFYVSDGHKYSHTIDIRTGYPVTHNLLSATIVCENAAKADAYATYCMVIGTEAAIKLIEGAPVLEGYLIYDEDGEMKSWRSEGL